MQISHRCASPRVTARRRGKYYTKQFSKLGRSATVKSLILIAPNPKTQMFLIVSCSCLCPIHWSQVFSWEWRCSWSSANRQCCNIWMMNSCIVYKGVAYIRGLTVFTWPQWFKHFYQFFVKISIVAMTLSHSHIVWAWMNTLVLNNLSIQSCACEHNSTSEQFLTYAWLKLQ